MTIETSRPLIYRVDNMSGKGASEIVVEPLKVTSLGVNKAAIDKSLHHLIPTRLVPQHCEVIVRGINNAESNAIRRTIGGELLVYSLYCDQSDVTTNDPFVIPELIRKRLFSVPVDQTVDPATVFELEITNNTPAAIDVKTAHMKITRGPKAKLPFNETTTLLTLGTITRPEHSGSYTYIKISNVRLVQGFGYIAGHGAQVVAFNMASVSLDQRPPPMFERQTAWERVGTTKRGGETYDPTGVTDPDILPEAALVPSSMSDPRVWKISFNTNGTMAPAAILRAACDSILTRLHIIGDMFADIENDGDVYVVTVKGESHTMGNLLVKNISELYPDIKIVTYNVNCIDRAFTIRIRCEEDITIVVESAVKRIKYVFGVLRAAFE